MRVSLCVCGNVHLNMYDIHVDTFVIHLNMYDMNVHLNMYDTKGHEPRS